MSFFYLLEKRLVDFLLRSPTFTKGVQHVHKRVHTLQHGKPPEYHNPTQLDTDDAIRSGGLPRFFKLFWDELKSGHRPNAPASPPVTTTQQKATPRVGERDKRS